MRAMKLSRRKRGTFRRIRKSGKHEDMELYKKLQKDTKHECRKAYDLYVKDIVSQEAVRIHQSQEMLQQCRLSLDI